MLQTDIVSDTQEVDGRIADIRGRDFGNLPGHTVDGIVGQVFRRQTTPAHKDLDQPAPDFLVFVSSLFPVRVEPSEQTIKYFLSQIFFLKRAAVQSSGTSEITLKLP